MEIHADQSFGDQLIRNSSIWFSLQPLVRAATVYWFVFVIDGCSCFTANQLVLMCFERTPRLNQQNQWFDPRLKAMVGVERNPGSTEPRNFTFLQTRTVFLCVFKLSRC
jgi:hypothetical protein